MDSDAANDYSPVTSSASTPSTAELLPCSTFQPKFIVNVTESFHSSDRCYIVKTIRKPDNAEFNVNRSFDDFETLHCMLSAEINANGIIMPPLPERSSSDVSSTELLSRRSSVDPSSGRNFFIECSYLEKYLTLVTNHSLLGGCSCLELFLTKSEAPAQCRNPQVGLLGKLMMAATDSRKQNHVDIDDFFQKTRISSHEYYIRIHLAAKAFENSNTAQRKLSAGHAKLGQDIHSLENSAELNSLLAKFSDVLDNIRHCMDTDAANSENTLGFQLEHQRRYSCSLKDMLNNRTQLLIDYEEASKAFDKAKPLKRTMAEEAKAAAERSLEECSEVARNELADYHRQRRAELKESLCSFTEAKIQSATELYALLDKSLTSFKQN